MLMAGWQLQTLSYTGDGVVGRAILTAFPLNSGIVAIWIVEAGAFSPKFRHNGAGMTGTATVGSSTISAGMITGFTATGFTVGTSGGVLGTVNTLGAFYTAIVLRDTTPDQKYMRIGTYAGLGTSGCTFTVSAALSPLGRRITTNTFLAGNVGQTFTVSGHGSYTLTEWTSAAAARMAPAFTGNLGTPITGTILGDDRLIVTGATPPWLPTHVWVFGRGAPYRGLEHSGDSSHDLAGEASKTATDQIQGFRTTSVIAGFEVGSDNNVNNSALTYHWVAFRFTAAHLAEGFFQSYTITGTTATPDRATVGFLPAVSMALRLVGAGAIRRRRQPQDLNLSSRSMAGTTDATAGITAHGPGTTLDLGENIAATGADIYGFAFGGPPDPGGTVYDGGPPLPDPCPITFPPGVSSASPGCAAPVLA